MRKGSYMRYRLATFATVGVFVYVQFAQAAMSSSNYEIRWDTVSTGGSDTSSSASYLLRDTVSGAAGGTGSSTTYQLTDGYRAGIFDQVITFDLYIQNSSNERAITALSGTTVSMSSTTGLSASDYVAVVQNRGGSQVVGFGRIQSVGAGSIVLDRLTVGSSSPSIDGTNDYLYQLNGSALTLETLDGSTVGTGIAAFEVTVDNDSGYSVQILEDGNLRVGSDVIDDVGDGNVTAGSEEYGARSSDTTLSSSTFDTQDTAITTTSQDVATSSTFAFDERSFLVLKAAGSSSSTANTYSHTITFIASGNF